MQFAKVTSKGQVTLPISIRRALNVQEGDRVAFVEKNGKFEIVNSNDLAFEKIREAFQGEAERLGLNSVDDVVAMIKELRNTHDENNA